MHKGEYLLYNYLYAALCKGVLPNMPAEEESAPDSIFSTRWFKSVSTSLPVFIESSKLVKHETRMESWFRFWQIPFKNCDIAKFSCNFNCIFQLNAMIQLLSMFLEQFFVVPKSLLWIWHKF